MLLVTPIFLESPYFEAPGFSILVAGTGSSSCRRATLETLVLVAFAVGLVLAVATAPRASGRPPSRPCSRRRRCGPLVWNATGELYAARASNTAADNLIQGFPDPPTWVDDATKGAPTLYLGKQVTNANGIYLLEFWNRAIEKVWSVDGTAPAPTLTPDLANADGTLAPSPGVNWVVERERRPARGGEDRRAARVVAALSDRRSAAARVLGRRPPRRRLDELGGELHAVRPQGRADGAGFVKVFLSRSGWCGPDIPGNVTITVGSVVVSRNQPAIGQVRATREGVLHSLRRTAVPDPGHGSVPRRGGGPGRASRPPSSTSVAPTHGQLGAQPSFEFVPLP